MITEHWFVSHLRYRGGFFVGEIDDSRKVAVSGFGMIVAIDIKACSEVTIDTGHMVASDSCILYEIAIGRGQNQGLFGLLVNNETSEELMAFKIRGPGKNIVYSRNRSNFQQWIASIRGKR